MNYNPSDLTLTPITQNSAITLDNINLNSSFDIDDFNNRYKLLKDSINTDRTKISDVNTQFTNLQNEINGCKTRINSLPLPKVYTGTCYSISASDSYVYVNLDNLSTYKEEDGISIDIRFLVNFANTWSVPRLYLNQSGKTPLPINWIINSNDRQYEEADKDWKFFPPNSIVIGQIIRLTLINGTWFPNSLQTPCLSLRNLYDASNFTVTEDWDYYPVSSFNDNVWYKKSMSSLYNYIHSKLVTTYKYTTTTPPKDDYAVTDIPSTHKGWYFICIRGVYNNSYTFMSSTVLYNYERFGYLLNPIIRYTNGSIYTQYIECLFATGTLKLKYWSPYDEKISATNFEISVVLF